MSSNQVAGNKRDEGQQTDYVPPNVYVALAIALALRKHREQEMPDEEEEADSMLADPRSPDLTLSDSDALSEVSYASKSSYVSCASEEPQEPIQEQKPLAARDGAKSASEGDVKPLEPLQKTHEVLQKANETLQKFESAVVEDAKPIVFDFPDFPSNREEKPGEMDHKVFMDYVDPKMEEPFLPPTPLPQSPKLRRSPRNHRSSVEPESPRASQKMNLLFRSDQKSDRETLMAGQRESSVPLTPPPAKKSCLTRNRRGSSGRRVTFVDSTPPMDRSLLEFSEEEDEVVPVVQKTEAEPRRKVGRPRKENQETSVSTPRPVLKAKVKKTTVPGERKLTRRDFDHRRAGSKFFWSRLIGVQVEWMTKMCTETFTGAEVVGFTLDSWDLLTKSFSWLKTVRTVEVHHLVMTFLANSIKIYELLTVRGFEEVFTALLDFVRGVLRKYLSFPKKMHELDMRWIQAREALRMVLNHLTQKELLLTVMNQLVELQQRFLATWTSTEEPPAEMDMDFVCYGIDQLTHFVSSVNARVQQAQRMDVYGLGF